VNKSELIADITSQYHSVGQPFEMKTSCMSGFDNSENIKMYNISTYTTENDIMSQGSVNFYVSDEGLGTEEAYYTLNYNVFEGKLKDKMASMISDETILTGSVESFDEAGKYGIIQGFVLSDNRVSEVKYFVYTVNDVLTANLMS